MNRSTVSPSLQKLKNSQFMLVASMFFEFFVEFLQQNFQEILVQNSLPPCFANQKIHRQNPPFVPSETQEIHRNPLSLLEFYHVFNHVLPEYHQLLVFFSVSHHFWGENSQHFTFHCCNFPPPLIFTWFSLRNLPKMLEKNQKNAENLPFLQGNLQKIVNISHFLQGNHPKKCPKNAEKSPKKKCFTSCSPFFHHFFTISPREIPQKMVTKVQSA